MLAVHGDKLSPGDGKTPVYKMSRADERFFICHGDTGAGLGRGKRGGKPCKTRYGVDYYVRFAFFYGLAHGTLSAVNTNAAARYFPKLFAVFLTGNGYGVGVKLIYLLQQQFNIVSRAKKAYSDAESRKRVYCLSAYRAGRSQHRCGFC